MTLFSGLNTIVKPDEPMAKHTWLRMGGPAKYFIEPASVEQLKDVVRRCRENDVSIHVLGGGANVLVPDKGIDGAVIRIHEGCFQDVIWDGGRVQAGAGAQMGKVVLDSVRRGMSGMECLTGIPGTVGGCVKMNAGGTFGDIGIAVEVIHVMNYDGEIFTRHRADLVFAYRSTNINAPFILGAEFELSEDDPHHVLRQVKQIWIQKKNTQPLASGSCGCVFRNPRGMSAGAIIDHVGLKGHRIGGAYVSEKHANFILADPGTTATDMLELIRVIRETVDAQAGVHLELELEVW